MVAEFICVGTEILMGNIVNTNVTFLSQKCAMLGIGCFYQQVVGDNEKRMEDAIRLALSRSDVIILCGGLGPTQDDMTKEICAKVWMRPLYLHEESKTAIQAYFERRNIAITDNNWKQALVPENAIVMPNPNGTAPGIIMEQDGKHMILLPGPPNELKPMFQDQVMPYLENLEPGVIYSQMVKLAGVGESKAEAMIQDLIEAQTNPTLATYAKTGEVHIRVTARAESKKKAKELVAPMVETLRERFGKAVYTTKETVTLEEAVVKLLKKEKLTICTAESCTGGLLAGRIVNVSGASKVFQNGFVTYANEAKRELLGVHKKTLKRYGAVSEETAAEMAKGAAKYGHAKVAVAVTGIAGPDGGTEEKPVGLVYIGCYVCGNIIVEKCMFSGSREKIRENSVAAALRIVREQLLAIKD